MTKARSDSQGRRRPAQPVALLVPAQLPRALQTAARLLRAGGCWVSPALPLSGRVTATTAGASWRPGHPAQQRDPSCRFACQPKTCSLHRRGGWVYVYLLRRGIKLEQAAATSQPTGERGETNPACYLCWWCNAMQNRAWGGGPRRSVLRNVPTAVAWSPPPAVEGNKRMIRACFENEASVKR